MKRGLTSLTIIVAILAIILSIYIFSPSEKTPEAPQTTPQEDFQSYCESGRECLENCGERNCQCINNKCIIIETSQETGECELPGQSPDEYAFGKFIGARKCCDGLTSIPNTIQENGNCITPDDPGTICSDCGNNECENWENSCNCPADCS